MCSRINEPLVGIAVAYGFEQSAMFLEIPLTEAVEAIHLGPRSTISDTNDWIMAASTSLCAASASSTLNDAATLTRLPNFSVSRSPAP